MALVQKVVADAASPSQNNALKAETKVEEVEVAEENQAVSTRKRNLWGKAKKVANAIRTFGALKGDTGVRKLWRLPHHLEHKKSFVSSVPPGIRCLTLDSRQQQELEQQRRSGNDYVKMAGRSVCGRTFMTHDYKTMQKALMLPSEQRSPRAVRLLVDAVVVCPFFSTLELPGVTSVCWRMTSQSFKEGDVIFKQGDPARVCYVVSAGSVSVVVKRYSGYEYTATYLFPAESFGEEALDSAPEPVNRQYTAVASSDVELFCITKEMAKSLMTMRIEQNREHHRFLTKRLRAPLFSGVAYEMVAELCEEAETKVFPTDSVIVTQGDEAQNMFVVRRGFVRLLRKLTWRGQLVHAELATLTEGDVFGVLRAPHKEEAASLFENPGSKEKLSADVVLDEDVLLEKVRDLTQQGATSTHLQKMLHREESKKLAVLMETDKWRSRHERVFSVATGWDTSLLRDSRLVYPFSAVAQAEVDVVALPTHLVHKVVSDHPELHARWMRELNRLNVPDAVVRKQLQEQAVWQNYKRGVTKAVRYEMWKEKQKQVAVEESPFRADEWSALERRLLRPVVTKRKAIAASKDLLRSRVAGPTFEEEEAQRYTRELKELQRTRGYVKAVSSSQEKVVLASEHKKEEKHKTGHRSGKGKDKPVSLDETTKPVFNPFAYVAPDKDILEHIKVQEEEKKRVSAFRRDQMKRLNEERRHAIMGPAHHRHVEPPVPEHLVKDDVGKRIVRLTAMSSGSYVKEDRVVLPRSGNVFAMDESVLKLDDGSGRDEELAVAAPVARQLARLEETEEEDTDGSSSEPVRTQASENSRMSSRMSAGRRMKARGGLSKSVPSLPSGRGAVDRVVDRGRGRRAVPAGTHASPLPSVGRDPDVWLGMHDSKQEALYGDVLEWAVTAQAVDDLSHGRQAFPYQHPVPKRRPHDPVKRLHLVNMVHSHETGSLSALNQSTYAAPAGPAEVMNNMSLARLKRVQQQHLTEDTLVHAVGHRKLLQSGTNRHQPRPVHPLESSASGTVTAMPTTQSTDALDGEAEAEDGRGALDNNKQDATDLGMTQHAAVSSVVADDEAAQSVAGLGQTAMSRETTMTGFAPDSSFKLTTSAASITDSVRDPVPVAHTHTRNSTSHRTPLLRTVQKGPRGRRFLSNRAGLPDVTALLKDEG